MLGVRVSTSRDVCVSIKKHETCIQNSMSSRHKKPKSPHPYWLEACSSDISITDLRDYLIKKRSIHQITPQCHCERLISAILSDCHCGLQITKPSIFSRLSAASNSVKRWWSRKIVLWCRVSRIGCKHGGIEFHTKQVQREATGCQFKGVRCWSISRF